MDQTLYLEKEDGRISFDDTGDTNTNIDKPVLIGVPGIGDLRGQYRFLKNLFLQNDYRFVSMDLRGLGDSTVQNWKNFSAQSVGEDIVDLIAQLKIDSARGCIILGNSMASAAAVWCAAELPEIVKGIVLFGPFVRDPPMNFLVRWLLKLLFGGPWGAAIWSMYYRSSYKTNIPEDMRIYQQKLKQNLNEPGRYHAMYSSLFAPKQSCTDRIQEINIPVLVFMGEKDGDFSNPKAEVEWIQSNFPKDTVEAHMIAGAGHYPHVEYPTEIAQKIRDFSMSLIRSTN